MNNFEKAVSGEVVENDGSELVVFEKKTVVEALESGGELDFLMAGLEKSVEDFEHDMSTGVSRGRSASLSRRVSSFKVEVVDIGMATIKERDDTVKAMKKSINKFKDRCDEVRDKAKEPLIEWRAEDARLKAVEAARLEAEKLLSQFNNDHEMGLLLDDKWNRDFNDFQEKAALVAKAELEEVERERIAYEAKIAEEAAAKAIADAEYKAKLEAELVKVDKFNSDHEIALLTNNKLITDAEKIASDERAKVQAEEAEKRRVEAVENARLAAIEAAENARLAEIKRQEDAALLIKAEDKKREENKRHTGSINRAAKEALMKYVDADTAKKIVIAVYKGEIPNITIKY